MKVQAVSMVLALKAETAGLAAIDPLLDSRGPRDELVLVPFT
jgi:hypothetical protein